eukprot:COSAG02_NODE_2504_length_8663_cov_3.628211_4_plen_637_part_00
MGDEGPQQARHAGATDAEDGSLAPEYPLPSATAVSVEYPGFVRDTEACLNTLGCEGGELHRTLDTQAQSLQLRMRPGDPMSRPIYGDSVASNHLLLRVRRPKQNHSRHQPAGLPEPEPKYDARVVGVVTKTYRFDAMADFQYLGDLSKQKGQLSEAESSRVIEQLIADEEATAGDDDELLDLAPSVFSKIDSPRDYAFKPNPNAKSMMRMAATASSAPGGASRRRRPTGSENSVGRRSGSRATLEASLRNVAVDYLQGQDIMSEAPTGVISDPTDDRQRKLQELFDERPIWSRLALSDRFPEIQPAALKRFLPCVGFYFVNGPWRLLWCRYGYDPNSDSSSRKYQVIDFRMPRILARTKSNSASTVSTKPEAGTTDAATGDSLGTSTSSQSQSIKGGQERGNLPAAQVAKPMHTFECIPEQGQTFYQLCDLRDPDMAVVVNKSRVSAECDPKLGWYTKEALLQLRRLMKRKLQEFLVEAGIRTNIDGYVKATGKLDTEWIQMTAAGSAVEPPLAKAAASREAAALPKSSSATNSSQAVGATALDKGVDDSEMSPSVRSVQSEPERYKDDIDEEDDDDDSDDDESPDEDDDDDDDDDMPQSHLTGPTAAAAAAAPSTRAADSLSAFEEFAIFGDDSD